eukprot:2556758-Ditylum_brightwellii.AAC.1
MRITFCNGSCDRTHHRCHDAGDLQSTVNVVYTPHINSIQQLHAATIKLLVEEDKLKEGVDFHIPSQKWLMLQLSPTDETRKTANIYTGCLPIKRQLQSCNTQSYHHHAHWCAQIKKI